MTFEVDNGSWHDADDLVLAAETAPPGGDDHGGRVKWAIAVAQQYGGHGTSGTHYGEPEVDGIIEALCILAAVSLPELQARGLRDSAHWFPNLHVDVETMVEHYAVGLVGEVGELCQTIGRRPGPLGLILDQAVELGDRANRTKKANRDDDIAAACVAAGGTSARSSVSAPDCAATELPDVFIYLLDLAAAMRIDIGAAVEAKRGVLMQRWGDPENVAPGTPRPA